MQSHIGNINCFYKLLLVKEITKLRLLCLTRNRDLGTSMLYDKLQATSLNEY